MLEKELYQNINNELEFLAGYNVDDTVAQSLGVIKNNLLILRYGKANIPLIGALCDAGLYVELVSKGCTTHAYHITKSGYVNSAVLTVDSKNNNCHIRVINHLSETLDSTEGGYDTYDDIINDLEAIVFN